MDMAYIHTYIDHPYADGRDYKQENPTCTIAYDPSGGRGDVGRMMVVTVPLKFVMSSLVSMARKGEKVRAICSHGRIIARHSDIGWMLSSGSLELRNVPGEWISRVDGNTYHINGTMFAANEPRTMLCVNAPQQRLDITVVDIGCYGVPWDQFTHEVQPDDPLSGDDIEFSCDFLPYGTWPGWVVLSSLYDEYKKVCRDYRVGRPTLTYASQGNASYNMRGFHVELRNSASPPVLNMEINGHFGGRQEAFGYGRYEGECALYDISAFYPHIATMARVPLMLLDKNLAAYEVHAKSWVRDYYYIADVTIDARERKYPFRKGFETAYPLGEFRTVLHQCELQAAMQDDCIKDMHTLAVYELGTPLANNANYLLSARASAEMQGNKLHSHYLKCMAVGWLGRLGAKHSPWEDFDAVVPPDKTGGWSETVYQSNRTTKLRSIADRVQRQLDDYIPYQGSVAVAGAITAYGRERLWHLMQYAGMEEVLYVSTDSLLVCGSAKRRLDYLCRDGGFIPGGLRRVSLAEGCVIAGKGLYCVGEKEGRQGWGRQAAYDGFSGFARTTGSIEGASEAAEGGYDPANSPLRKSYASVMHRAGNTPWKRFDADNFRLHD